MFLKLIRRYVYALFLWCDMYFIEIRPLVVFFCWNQTNPFPEIIVFSLNVSIYLMIEEICWTPLFFFTLVDHLLSARYFANGLASILSTRVHNDYIIQIDEIYLTSSYLNRLLFFLIRNKLKLKKTNVFLLDKIRN